MPAVPTASSPSATNAIGFLRLGLAGMVIYSHAYHLGGFGAEPLWTWSRETLHAGTLAVQSFFVLSGRLIAQSWLNQPHLLPFLRNRALRLLPALWVCLAVVAFVLTPLLHLARPADGCTWSQLLSAGGSYVWTNLFTPRAQIAIGPYPGGNHDWNGSLWTLFYEGASYVMIAGLGLATLLQKRRALGLALLLSILALNTLWHAAPQLLPAMVGRLFDTPGKQLTCFFFSGTVWALWPGLTAWLAHPVVPLASLGLLLTAIALGWHAGAGTWLLPPVLFWLALALPLRNLEHRLGGDYSYGLYLYGYPAQQCLLAAGGARWGFVPWLGLSLLGALALAIPSWHLVERAALARKAPRPAV